MSESETSRRAGSRAAPRPAPASRRARGAHTSGPQAQQHLLSAAAELFYREGVRAVGVDAVVERAGVNKMSLYRQFSSKDDLVMAYLEHKDAQFFGYVEKSFAKHPGDPARQLQQYFDDLAARASLEGYRGCPFVNVAVEFADTEHAARQFVFRNKERLLARLTELATAYLQDLFTVPDGRGRGVGRQLIEGVYAASQTYRAGSGPVLAAPKAAARLIAAACGGKVER